MHRLEVHSSRMSSNTEKLDVRTNDVQEAVSRCEDLVQGLTRELAAQRRSSVHNGGAGVTTSCEHYVLDPSGNDVGDFAAEFDVDWTLGARAAPRRPRRRGGGILVAAPRPAEAEARMPVSGTPPDADVGTGQPDLGSPLERAILEQGRKDNRSKAPSPGQVDRIRAVASPRSTEQSVFQNEIHRAASGA